MEREKKKAERKAEQAKKKAEREQRKMESRRAEKKGYTSWNAETFLVDECSSASSESGVESDGKCPGCGLAHLDDDTHSVWVACDICEIWHDFKCTGLKNPNRVPKKYICPDCKP